ncbi:hypothetical protein L7F22_066769 [Adiantum nelumboides]|nr:hypothetical protein [Adiantum nelumboides]
MFWLITVTSTMEELTGPLAYVVYLEDCESGSIFDDILSNDLNIYATTASNAVESSWETYYLGMVPAPPPEYLT